MGRRGSGGGHVRPSIVIFPLSWRSCHRSASLPLQHPGSHQPRPGISSLFVSHAFSHFGGYRESPGGSPQISISPCSHL